MFSPYNLRCEYANEPVGIDVLNPRFSWTAKHPERGALQSAYQILVASRPELLAEGQADFWDSKKVVSDCGINVEYAGEKLLSGKTFYWKVRLWDGEDRPSDFSTVAKFTTGIMDTTGFKGEWLGSPSPIRGVAPLFRKSFYLDKALQSATAYICGLGYYELYINGVKVGKEVLNPGVTDYNKRVLYVTYQVEQLLNPGENVIGIILGEGWFGNDHHFIKDFIHWADYPKLLFQMNMDFMDGTSESIISGEHLGWKTASSHIIANNVYDGEVCDARLEKQGWNVPEYVLDDTWQEAVAVKPPKGKIVSQTMEPIEVIQHISPVRMTNPQRGVYVFDFGQNIAGWVRLTVSGKSGDRVEMKYAEVLYDNGLVNQENLMAAISKDAYILKGDGKEIYEPRFTYHGFRYVQVDGFPGVPDLSSVVGCVVHSAVSISGQFKCSNPLIERIHQNIIWTELDNLHSIPTDCPQRSERMAWLNDCTVRAEEMVYNLDVVRFLTKWEADITDTIDSKNGSIKDSAPAVFVCVEEGDPVNSSYILVPWLLYNHYSDKRILKEHYDGMKGWVQYLLNRSKNFIIEHEEHDLGDWASRESCIVSEENPRSAVTPSELISTGYFYYNAVLMTKISEILGYHDEKEYFLDLSTNIKKAYNERFYNAEKCQYATGSQGSNAFSVFLRLAPEADRRKIAENIVADIAHNDQGLTTGLLCTKYVMEVLCDEGFINEAYALAARTKYPSWGYMIEHGATTIWERWENSTGGGMNSHNHPMYGSIGAWFYRYLAGIRPDSGAPGFQHFVVSPYFPDELVYVDANLETMMGNVSAGWQKEAGALLLSVCVPFGCTCEIVIPEVVSGNKMADIQEGRGPVYCEGRFRTGTDGILSARKDNGVFQIEIGAGSYYFICR